MSEKMQNRITRESLGIYKYSGYKWGYGLDKSSQDTNLEIIRFWSRVIMDNERITKVTFNWEYDLRLNNCCNFVKQILTEFRLQQNYETESHCATFIL